MYTDNKDVYIFADKYCKSVHQYRFRFRFSYKHRLLQQAPSYQISYKPYFKCLMKRKMIFLSFHIKFTHRNILPSESLGAQTYNTALYIYL